MNRNHSIYKALCRRICGYKAEYKYGFF